MDARGAEFRHAAVTLPPRCLTPRRGRDGHGSRGHGLSDEAQLRHLIELVDVTRKLEEGHQARSLARPEAVAELLEVAREEARWIPVALARLVRERLGLRTREANRAHQRLFELGQSGAYRLGTRPDREDHRQAGALEPQPSEVVVRRRVLERGLERRIADQQLCLRILAERNVLRL